MSSDRKRQVVELLKSIEEMTASRAAKESGIETEF